ncbi:hypothetical protein, partial [uncultured Prevotella sp.]
HKNVQRVFLFILGVLTHPHTLSLLLLSGRVLILQASYRYYIHTVLALVGKVAYGSKNHEKRKGLASPYFRSWRVFTSAAGAISLSQLARFYFRSWRF